MTKRKPGRRPFYANTRPIQTTSMMLFADQLARLDQYADTRRVSKSDVMRQALDLFFAVNSDVGTTRSVRHEEVSAA